MFKFIFVYILMTGVCFGGQKVYFDPQINMEVVDVSGAKSREQIVKEFGLSDSVEEITLNQGEAHKIKNNKLEKYNIAEETEKIKKEKDDAVKSKRTALKSKLGLTDKELKDLKEVLNAD